MATGSRCTAGWCSRIALGALFLANQIREFFVLDFGPSSSSYGSMYYVMTGFHALHVFAGLLLIVAAIAITTGAGTLERRTPAVESVELLLALRRRRVDPACS